MAPFSDPDCWLQIIIMKYEHCMKNGQTPDSKEIRRSEVPIFGNVDTQIKRPHI